MNNFNYKKVKDIKFTFHKTPWNAEAYNLLVSFDHTMKNFKIKMLKNEEKEITDLKEANQVLKKFRIK